MDKLQYKIENELDSLSAEERKEILSKLRDEVDEIDESLVKLISKRTLHSVLIGRVKRSLGLPTYNPEREKDVSKKINSFREDPLSEKALTRIYERILDESRAIQREELEKGNIFDLKSSKKISFKNLFSRKEFLIIAVFFAALLSIFYYTFFTPNYYKQLAPVKFEIKKGQILDQIVNHLYRDGIIPSKFNMKAAVFIYGAEKKLRAARYYIPNGLSYLDLIDLFTDGPADFLRPVRIHNGASIKWIASKLRYKVFTDSSDFVNLTNNTAFIDSLGLNQKTLEGYLLPETYELYERSSPREIIDSMYAGFNRFIVDSLKERAEKLGYSLHEVLTLASIVEGETNRASEMPVIAEVYYNRLKKGMKLQADPTVQYLQPNGWKRLLYKDLEIDSPYNTYKYAGLPPGPINNPGKDAILAALYPDDNNYIFFVADGTGGHTFSKTYSEHLRKVAKYRRWLRLQKNK